MQKVQEGLPQERPGRVRRVRRILPQVSTYRSTAHPIEFFRCDNHYVIEAETPEDKGKLVIEFEQERGFEHKMFKDEREKEKSLSLK